MFGIVIAINNYAKLIRHRKKINVHFILQTNLIGVISLTNKEKIFHLIKKICIEHKDEYEKGVTANDISQILNIKRNVVSHYLNELHQEEKLYKINTRPVYFKYKQDIGTKPLESKSKAKPINEDCLSSLIGANESLKTQIEQCKIAASYPNNGLPIILTGESGVGKSHMAQLVHEYSITNGYIDKNAPFIILNCAEYANNPELLSAKLFGYKKGAFTGANSDTSGLIEEANNGYLFLDEVHRLPPEGQEKLFLILDKGICQRLGESGVWRKVSIRFIFATTEDPEKILLETFLRRIPLNIKIPPLSERTICERLNFAYKFFKDEAQKINTDIEVSKQVLNVLLVTKLNGNIGKLINVIKYSCAHAYTESINNKNKKILIHLNNLPRDVLVESYNTNSNKYNFTNMVVSLKDKEFTNDKVLSNSKNIEHTILDLAKLAEQYEGKNSQIDEFRRKVNIEINKITDELVFNREEYGSEIPINVMAKLVEEGLKILEKKYGIRYYGNTSNILSQTLNYFWQNIQNISKKDKRLINKAEEILKKLFPRYYIIATKLLNLVEINIDYKFDNRVLIYLIYYVFSVNSKTETLINSIIIAHGYSTASSIASVANNLIGDFIFEAFDMPIEVSVQEMTNKISEYLDTVDTTKGLIVLVDMGSLEEIYKPILDKMRGDVAVINNITTQIALDVGLKIKQGHSIGEIIENIDIWNKISCKYIKYDNKKKNAILSTCISGIGTAVKIRDLLKECIDDESIEVVAYDFNKIKNNGIEDKIFKEYNVILIIGTSKLNISEIPFMCIEELITGNGEKILNNALKNKLKNRTVEEVNKDIVKKFSLQNVLNQLTILNPNRIIDQVERAISQIEFGVRRKFSNSLKVSLYVHISCLIERIIVKDYVEDLNDQETFVKENQEFIKLINNAFEEISNIYRLEIPIAEVQIIHQIIKNI